MLLRCAFALVVACPLSVVTIEVGQRSQFQPQIERKNSKPSDPVVPNRVQTAKPQARRQNRKQKPSRKPSQTPPKPSGGKGIPSPVRQSPPPFEEKAFQIIDQDRDRRITSDEVEALKVKFAELASNGALKDPVKKRVNLLLTTLDIAKADDDKDGALTMEEWRGAYTLWLAEVAEQKQGYQSRAPRPSTPAKPPRPAQDRKAQQESKRAKRHEERDAKVFAYLDKNGDGSVEDSEVEEARVNLRRGKEAGDTRWHDTKMEVEHRFLIRSLRDNHWHARADQSGDGRLTLNELRTFHESAREARKVSSSNRRAGMQQGGNDAQFRILDRDKDGKITSTELNLARKRLESREARGRAKAFEISLIDALRSQDSFANLDTDGSGDIDRVEWKLAQSKSATKQQEL